MAFVAHGGGESGDHVGVRDVLFLGSAGHRQVVQDQPGDQLGVFGGDRMLCTEFACIDGAELGVSAAATFGDVVEEGGDIEHPRVFEVADQLAAERVFVAEFRLGKAAQVAQNAQDVLIDGVDVEQVVLHLADDGAEVREVISQNLELVHPPHFMQDTTRGLEQKDEVGLIDRVGAERLINQVARPPERADRPGRHPFEFVVRLHQQESLENRVRRFVEDVLVRYVEQLMGILEARVDRDRRVVWRGEDGGAEVLQQDGVELHDRLGGAVVLLHQLLAGAACRRAGKPQFFGQRRLVIEEQTVFASADVQVQVQAQALQEAFAPGEPLCFALGDEAVQVQIVPTVAKASSLGDPEDGLQVTQAAGAFFAVGLEAVRRFLIA